MVSAKSNVKGNGHFGLLAYFGDLGPYELHDMTDSNIKVRMVLLPFIILGSAVDHLICNHFSRKV